MTVAWSLGCSVSSSGRVDVLAVNGRVSMYHRSSDCETLSDPIVAVYMVVVDQGRVYRGFVVIVGDFTAEKWYSAVIKSCLS